MRPERVLVVSPFVPSLDAPHGAARVVAGWLAEMSRRRSVGLVYVRAADEPPIDPSLAERLDVCRDVVRRRPGPLRRVRLLIGLLRGRPEWVQAWPMCQVRDTVDEIVGVWQPDVVQAELSVMGSVLRTCRGPARVLVVHDPAARAAGRAVELSSGLRRTVARLDHSAWTRDELRSLRGADAVVAFTGADAVSLPSEVTVIPFGVELPRRAADPVGHDRPEVLFVGGPGHPPNVEAVERLLGRVAPSVVARHPEVRFVILGDWSGVELPGHGCAGPCEHVVLPGRVVDTWPWIERAAVVVAPVTEGGGMRVKVVEALAAGKALVATSVALEGLGEAGPGADQVVVRADGDREFAAAVADLLDRPADRAVLGAAARRWARRWLSWSRCADGYEALYDGLGRRQSLVSEVPAYASAPSADGVQR